MNLYAYGLQSEIPRFAVAVASIVVSLATTVRAVNAITQPDNSGTLLTVGLLALSKRESACPLEAVGGVPEQFGKVQMQNTPRYLRKRGEALSKEVLLRFVVVNPQSQCWEWQRTKCMGYGVLTVNKRHVQAHRLAYAFWNGEIPAGLWVLHRCDNRKCINPEHLFLGTALDNNRDTISKGRRGDTRNFGESNGFSKLTWRDISYIRNSLEPRKVIAINLGVTTACIGYIQRGAHWNTKE